MKNLTINQLLDKIYNKHNSVEIKTNCELFEVHKKLKLAKVKEDGNTFVENSEEIIKKFGL
jgi:NADPH-dependent 2,4-dienoyl-CoA reductase/sulfur reductase-like enzyme